MLNSKSRAHLRALANVEPAILQLGKSGLPDTLVKQVDDALTARELVKLTVLETSPVSASEAAAKLADRTGAEVVQAIGRKFTLYRRNPKAPKIELP